MSWLYASAATESDPLSDWSESWDQTSSDLWAQLHSDLDLQMDLLSISCPQRHNGVGVGARTAEPALAAQIQGSVAQQRELAHRLAQRFDQYAVRLVHDGGPHHAFIAPLESLRRGIGILDVLDVPGTVLPHELHVQTPDVAQAEVLIKALPNARRQHVTIERVSGQRRPWWLGRGIIMRQN